MVTQAEILDAMQFSYLTELNPINTTTAPARVISYQYAGTVQPEDLPTGTAFSGWTNFTSAEKTAFEDALRHIESVINVTFVEVYGQADPDMNVGKVSIPGSTAGYGGNSASWIGSEVVSFDNFVVYDNTLDLTSRQHLMLHELAHSLGLKHPFEGTHVLPEDLENNRNTLMSYTPNPDNGLDSDTLQRFDILALQDIWGAASNNADNTTYSGPRTNTVDTIWDTGGRDTFEAKYKTNAVTLDLREGSFSSFDSVRDVAIAFGTTIEKAKGSRYDDTLIGNQVKNTLIGRNGDDTIFGGDGHDVLKGGGGDDILEGQNGNDKLIGNAGADLFVFNRYDDKDTIKRFTDGVDTLKVTGYGDVDDVMSMASQEGRHVVFDFGNGDMITVTNMSVSTLWDDVIV